MGLWPGQQAPCDAAAGAEWDHLPDLLLLHRDPIPCTPSWLQLGVPWSRLGLSGLCNCMAGNCLLLLAGADNGCGIQLVFL